ncbi:MAG: hypothetical protein ACD_2C00079G0015 [uncultured bacterium (gcode 4)]|uniref:Uncharacterized protein n=1 Tax=uncultured bacterium (gcode 4) TaxID=1234023 RepID=K2G3R6_9BACT|nr:MAG: hypothetical protein ACD_2C00079G0015 [uncultured bacterium (gcode 4)]
MNFFIRESIPTGVLIDIRPFSSKAKCGQCAEKALTAPRNIKYIGIRLTWFLSSHSNQLKK